MFLTGADKLITKSVILFTSTLHKGEVGGASKIVCMSGIYDSAMFILALLTKKIKDIIINHTSIYNTWVS